MAVNHEFGGLWTEQKLGMLKEYMQAYLKVLKNQDWIKNRIYIDAFAGTGFCTIKRLEHHEQIQGSASIAVDLDPAFDHYYFIDQKEAHIKELQQIKENNQSKQISTLQGDANTLLARIFENHQLQTTRYVLFLDAYGFEIDWSTMEMISKVKEIDVVLLVPLSGICRNLPNSFAAQDESKKRALNKMLGTSDWENFYEESPQGDLFDTTEADKIRVANWQDITKFVKQRYETIFSFVSKPAILRTNTGSPLYALFILLTNKSKGAQAIANRLSSSIMK